MNVESESAPTLDTRAIVDTEAIRLSREASEALATLLVNPPAPTKALRRAAVRHRRLIVSR